LLQTMRMSIRNIDLLYESGVQRGRMPKDTAALEK